MESHITVARQPATGLCHREGADNYDRVLVTLGDDWRIIECRDAIQFILQRRPPETVLGARWRGFRYHRNRSTFPEVWRRSAAFPDATQFASIDALPAICGRA